MLQLPQEPCLLLQRRPTKQRAKRCKEKSAQSVLISVLLNACLGCLCGDEEWCPPISLFRQVCGAGWARQEHVLSDTPKITRGVLSRIVMSVFPATEKLFTSKAQESNSRTAGLHTGRSECFSKELWTLLGVIVAAQPLMYQENTCCNGGGYQALHPKGLAEPIAGQ